MLILAQGSCMSAEKPLPGGCLAFQLRFQSKQHLPAGSLYLPHLPGATGLGTLIPHTRMKGKSRWAGLGPVLVPLGTSVPQNRSVLPNILAGSPSSVCPAMCLTDLPHLLGRVWGASALP